MKVPRENRTPPISRLEVRLQQPKIMMSGSMQERGNLGNVGKPSHPNPSRDRARVIDARFSKVINRAYLATSLRVDLLNRKAPRNQRGWRLRQGNERGHAAQGYLGKSLIKDRLQVILGSLRVRTALAINHARETARALSV
jgi:hypothetical protein